MNNIPAAKPQTLNQNPDEMAKFLFFRHFGLTEKIIEKALSMAIANGGDYADFYGEYIIQHAVSLEESIVKSSSQSITMGVGIRTVAADKTGYAFCESFASEEILNTARQSAAIADNHPVSKTVQQLQQLNYHNHYPISRPLKDLELSQRVEWLKKADTVARQTDARVTQVNAGIVDNTTYVVFANSLGQLYFDIRPMLRSTINVICEENGQKESASSGGGGRIGIEYFDQKPIEYHAKEAVRQATTMLSAKNAPAGEFPVVLKSAQSGILLHEAVGHPLEADFIRRNTSAYSNRVGEKVASEHCTIIDDGTIANDRGSLNFDDEGVPTRRNVLIENGILKGYMQDRISAAKLGMPLSGNGRRESFQYAPMPRMTTTYMAGGEYAPEEVIASVDKGVYCCTFRGGQVDIANGDFVFVPVEAYWIENGKIQHPVKNFTLIGNGPDVMTRVSMVGNDFAISDGMWTCGKGQQVPVGVGLPTVKIDAMTVGGQ
jgi:TldD protein